MNHKYDVGIVGCWYWGNYGSLLNGYSTFTTLKKLGLKPLNIVTPYNKFEAHAQKFFDAVYKMGDISDTLSFERVKEYNSICDFFLSGSDQIWHHNPNKSDRRYDYYFRLDFASEYKKKLSFSTSLGRIECEHNEIYANYKRLYDRYDAISLREYQSVELFKERYGINATELIEPVFVLDKAAWNNIAEYSEYKPEGDYIFSYILDPNSSKRNMIIDISSQYGIRNITALDGFSAYYDTNYKKLNLDNILPNICASDLIRHFREAKFIVTDSFHGMCFAIIFNKPFIAIGNAMRGIDRFRSLLNKLDLERNLIDENNISEVDYLGILKNRIHFDKVNNTIELEKKKSIDWLKNEIEKPTRLFRTIGSPKLSINDVLSPEKCVGCGACVSKCGINAIALKEDEAGSYRGVVDFERCVKCGQCISVCPAIYLPKNNNTDMPTAYAYVNNDIDIQKDSSSGGAFSALANIVLDKGGCVVGAKWNEDFSVSHTIIKSKEELYFLRKSKYLQSFMGDVFRDVKKLLDKNEYVLFSGVPCQVSGLKKYLSFPYEKLIMVDVLCANCPPNSLFSLYEKERFGVGQLYKYEFRYKNDNLDVWDCYSSKACDRQGMEYILDRRDDSYLKMFHSCSIGISSQCRTCKYQGVKRMGDITIGDCWGIQNFDSSVNPKYGVSVILVNNDKGELLLEELRKEKKGVLKEEPLDEVRKYNRIAFTKNRNWRQSVRSKVFWENLNKGFNEAVNKAYNCESEPIRSFKISSFDDESISFCWDTNLEGLVSGYIIEKYRGNQWERVKKIEDKKILSVKLPFTDSLEGAKYRIKTYYMDESVALYGKMKEISINNE